MNLPGGSKTKTGQWSTGARELEELAEQGHQLPRKILDWRQVSKLRSTYTEALPTYVNPTTHRVHTSYALAATSTGRLSSSEPNLQNIPVRTEEGRKIRRAFVAAPGMKLVSADYSQIELRLLSEVAEVPALRKAFQDGIDIHAMTASEMFGVPVKDMPSEVRRRAKAINFGIIYGISAYGLGAQLGIDPKEAGSYIKKYFDRFPGIRAYMDETREFCRANGYVLTLFGRKCHYPDIKASNASIRSFNERAAINARLQGSAADIIRRAMIRMEGELDRAKLNAQMLLQVHDELIFEVPDGEVAKTMPVVKRVMEDAPHPAISLHVPLQVDARAAGTATKWPGPESRALDSGFARHSASKTRVNALMASCCAASGERFATAVFSSTPCSCPSRQQACLPLSPAAPRSRRPRTARPAAPVARSPPWSRPAAPPC